MKSNKEINWELLAKDLSGESDLETKNSQDSSFVEFDGVMDEVRDIWEDAKYAQEMEEINTEAAWGKVQQEIRRNKSLRIKKMIYSVAAILIFIVGSYVSFQTLGFVNHDIHVAEDGVTNFQLKDGSSISLNVGSELVYDTNFGKEERRVKLKGEGFFEVSRDEQKPFIIEAGDIEIKVLGTAFNINTYKSEHYSSVTVESGRVLVTALESNDSVELTKGEIVTFTPSNGQLLTSKNTNVNYNAWKTRTLKFNNTGLEEVFQILEDVYHVDIQSDSILKPEDEQVITATFKDHSLEHILKSVCFTFNYKYDKNADDTVFEIKK